MAFTINRFSPGSDQKDRQEVKYPREGLVINTATTVKGSNKYDLYAVAKHYGIDKSGGHYEAACLDPITRKWYNYSDTKVSEPLTSEM